MFKSLFQTSTTNLSVYFLAHIIMFFLNIFIHQRTLYELTVGWNVMLPTFSWHSKTYLSQPSNSLNHNIFNLISAYWTLPIGATLTVLTVVLEINYVQFTADNQLEIVHFSLEWVLDLFISTLIVPPPSLSAFIEPLEFIVVVVECQSLQQDWLCQEVQGHFLSAHGALLALISETFNAQVTKNVSAWQLSRMDTALKAYRAVLDWLIRLILEFDSFVDRFGHFQ